MSSVTAEDPTYVNANGVVIETIANKSVVGASAVNYKVLKPVSGNIVTWACSIDDIPTGTVSYKSTSSDLDEVGLYKVHPFITYPSGDTFPWDPWYFEVLSTYAKL